MQVWNLVVGILLIMVGPGLNQEAIAGVFASWSFAEGDKFGDLIVFVDFHEESACSSSLVLTAVSHINNNKL